MGEYLFDLGQNTGKTSNFFYVMSDVAGRLTFLSISILMN